MSIRAQAVVFAAMGKVGGMFSPMRGHVSPSVSPRNQVWKLPPGADPLAFAGLVLAQVGYNCVVWSYAAPRSAILQRDA